MQIKKWKILNSKEGGNYRAFRLRIDTALSPRTGNIHDFYVLEATPWVNVVPLTNDGDVILIEQYRHGTRDITLEIPGGMVETGDTPEGAAGRELLEETGYAASQMLPLGFVHPNPAIQNNLCYSFVALGTYFSGEQRQDESEDIAVVKKPLRDIPDLIRRGVITHSLVVVAFYRLFMETEIPHLR